MKLQPGLEASSDGETLFGQFVGAGAAIGGVGHVAVQLAKARGIDVTATMSSDSQAATALALGADRTVNRGEEPVE